MVEQFSFMPDQDKARPETAKKRVAAEKLRSVLADALEGETKQSRVSERAIMPKIPNKRRVRSPEKALFNSEVMYGINQEQLDALSKEEAKEIAHELRHERRGDATNKAAWFAVRAAAHDSATTGSSQTPQHPAHSAANNKQARLRGQQATMYQQIAMSMFTVAVIIALIVLIIILIQSR